MKQNFINYRGINYIIGEEGIFASIDGKSYLWQDFLRGKKMNINKRLNYNFRAGYRVNMNDTLQDLEDKYRSSLKATVDSFESYDEVSNETFNDAAIMKGQIRLLVTLGYLDDEEALAMIQVVDEIRLNILENLEKEGANNGSEKENI